MHTATLELRKQATWTWKPQSTAAPVHPKCSAKLRKNDPMAYDCSQFGFTIQKGELTSVYRCRDSKH